jgi:cellulose synthase/poly-beta-1,6-N-acetylglucosamine synthase-like glycosyltransferase
MMDALVIFCLVLTLLGMVPTLSSFAQFLIVGWHGVRNNYSVCRDHTPRVAFVLPAWNEAEVIGSSVDSLMSLSYPPGAWRIYVVDDASTDHTPAVMREKMAQYPGSVFHLRREVGGQGKAHTLNHGLRTILAEGWAEAVMIMDADVLFEPLTLRRMARHLADPTVGGVTAYVKEGSHPGNLLTRFIAFEYITAQAAARRAQNVMGVLACMAGGAQLHSRENLIAIGGAIDTSTLAEDTYTTFKTQLGGHRVVFDGNAVVWAEEPDSVTALWKQRLRWARGNLQLTAAFRSLWFRPGQHRRLGSAAFGVLWFSVALMPLFMILSSVGVVALYYLRPPWAWAAFTIVWSATFVAYLFETLFSFAIDPPTGSRTWFEGLVFPGVISLGIMLLAVSGLALFSGSEDWMAVDGWSWRDIPIQVILAWNGISTIAAWGVYRLDKAGAPKWLRNFFLVLIGYGPLMCAITFGAMVAQYRNASLQWDKTMKSGKVKILK